MLAGVDLGPEFRSMVDTVAKRLPRPADPRFTVLLDDLPDSSARLDLVRLAVIAVLERMPRASRSYRSAPATGTRWARSG